MALTFGSQVRPATVRDQDQISRLLSNGSFVHRHLDWRTPLEWIGFQPYYVIEHHHQILSVLACPPDPPLISWVRVFASSDEISSLSAWDRMWPKVLGETEANGSHKVGVIVLQNWFQSILERSHFYNHQDIVMLTWDDCKLSEFKLPDRFQLRRMAETDIPIVAEVDAMAFDPLWQNSTFALQKAFHQASLATVVEDQGVIVGYQLTTNNFMGAHLARLAVHPTLQGKGIGYSLVMDMIQRMNRVGITNISVNTQSDNLTSLDLYHRIGFKETGERYPVFSFDVN